MKTIIRFAAKAPKFACATAILLVGVVALLLWHLKRSFQNVPLNFGASEKVVSPFVVKDVVLCGNTLVDLNSGALVAQNWLDGFGNSAPSIAEIDEANRLLIVTGNHGAAGAFGFDGRAKELPSFEGAVLGPSAFDAAFAKAAFVRGGDIWVATVDWANSKVSGALKVSDVGYFRPDCLASPNLWHEDALLVSVLGKTLEVRTESGIVREVPVSVGELFRSVSPDGSFALMPVGRKVVVVDLENGESRDYEVGLMAGRILWLTPQRAVIRVGRNQLAQYDHKLRRIEGPKECSSEMREVMLPSPDGSCFLIVTGSEIVVVDLVSKRDSAMKLQFSNLEWLSNDTMLCSCDSVETEKRGVWLVTKTGEMERISSQPADRAAARPGASSLIRIEGGGIYVSRGDLWRFDLATKQIRQITHGRSLPADLLKLDLSL